MTSGLEIGKQIKYSLHNLVHDTVCVYLPAMQVLICLERFVAVCFPLKKASIFTKRRSYLSVLAVAGLLLVIYSPFFIIIRDAFPSRPYECGSDDTYFHEWNSGWIYTNVSFFIFIPFFLIVILTGLIIRGLLRSRRVRRAFLQNSVHDNHHRQQQQHQQQQLHHLRDRESTSAVVSSSASSQHDLDSTLISLKQHRESATSMNNRRVMNDAERVENTITFMLLMAALAFLILTLPGCVYILTFDSKTIGHPRNVAKWALIYQVQNLCIDLTHAVNFFIYFLSTRRFRVQLFRWMSCKSCQATCTGGSPGIEHNKATYHTIATRCTSHGEVSLSAGSHV